MNQQQGQARQGAMAADALSSMFLAVSGLRNLRAAVAMSGCFVAAVVVFGLFSTLVGGVTGYLLGGLLSPLLFFAGIHAAGVLLMDQARDLPPRTVKDAVVYGLLCVPKTIGLIVLLVLAGLAVYALIALLFWVCKLPGLGPLLYAVTLPLSVVASGLVFTALFLGLLLSLAAIWEGASVMGALAKVFAVLQTRLVEAVLLVAVVMVLAGIVMLFIASVLMSGYLPALGLSAGILPGAGSSLGGIGGLMPGPSFGGMSGPMAGGMMRSGAGALGGYALAGLFGSAILWALALTLTNQVALLGVSLAYLKLTDGLDASATEGALQARVADARRKAAELGAKAKEASERARAQAERAMEQRRQQATEGAADAAAAAQPSSPESVERAATLASVGRCPACAEPVMAPDLFCGSCGHRLQP